MTSKYIFLDVDGTLVSYESVLPQSAVEAIHQAQANGHKVFTVTGRSKAEMYKDCLLYTSPSPRDRTRSRMPSSA